MMKHLVVCLSVVMILSLPLMAQNEAKIMKRDVAIRPMGKAVFFSPIPAIGVGPNGLASAKITVTPYCCPSTAIEISSKGPSAEGDFQWVLIPLVAERGRTIHEVRVCYNVKSSEPGKTYISQTRLTQMTTPDAANVLLDDPTDQTSTTPTCYGCKTEIRPGGTITLALKVVFGDDGDRIQIGGITLVMD